MRVPGFSLWAVVFSILALIACGTSQSADSDAGQKSGPTANLALAPNFQLSLYQGEEVLGAKELSLSDLQGKPLVLNFWAGACPPCRAEMPDLQKFYNEYRDRLTLVGIDVGPFTGLGSRQNGKELLQELSISYPAGSTLDETVVRKYEILGMPSTFFITANGKIFRKWTGILNRAKLVEITEEMLAAQPALGEAGEGSRDAS